MKNTMRSLVILAAAVALTSTVCLADGEAVYKAKCASCHGATGTPNPGMAKMMGIKAANDPDMKKLSVDQIKTAVTAGKGKMKAIAGVAGQDLTDVATYFHNLK